MNASYNASIRCVNFSVTFFFTGPCCETWTVQYFECEDWCHDFNDFSEGPKGERMVNIGYMSKTNLLIISVHYFPASICFIYRGIFRTPKFLRTFSVTLLDWQPFKISIRMTWRLGGLSFFESSWSPGWGSMEIILHRCSWRNAFWCQPFPPWPTQASPNKNPRQKGLGRSGWRKSPELELPRRWKFETCLKSRKAKNFNGIKNLPQLTVRSRHSHGSGECMCMYAWLLCWYAWLSCWCFTYKMNSSRQTDAQVKPRFWWPGMLLPGTLYNVYCSLVAGCVRYTWLVKGWNLNVFDQALSQPNCRLDSEEVVYTTAIC